MNDNLFLIAIGGTGMRCLESFVHLCAAGLFDGKEINVLTLDTDQNNGNKLRVESLIRLYNAVKTADPDIEPKPTANTFFSAKLNLYRFYTKYSEESRSTLKALAETPNLNEVDAKDNEDLSDLLFERDSVQQFKLDHGYRAQTHLGSMLMYHGIVEAARNAKKGEGHIEEQDKDLSEFLQKISKGEARVFIFGSIFGGTGASSIPVVPRALNDALKILTNADIKNKVLFGSTLLTDYFDFAIPQESKTKEEKVIADSSYFALNSQAALSFYNNDITVRSTYKRLYHVGWPIELKIRFSNDNASDVKTGGKEQENPCHVVEMMCAAAAYDFFKEDRDVLAQIQRAEYVYRTIEVQEGMLRLTGSSFVGKVDGELFENKIGAFLSFAHIILSLYKGAKPNVSGTTSLIQYFERSYQEGHNKYKDLPREQRHEIDAYLKRFAYEVTSDAKLLFGWIYQIQDSIKKGNFIFSAEAFKQTIGELEKVDPGRIFADPLHHWDGKGFLGSEISPEKRFDKFVDNNLKNSKNLSTDEQGTSLREQFLAHMYNAITEAQHFNFKN